MSGGQGVPAGPPPEPGDVRVGDAERQAVVDRLTRACGEGVVTLDEFADLSAAAYAAITRDDLDAVLADLRLPVRIGEPAATGSPTPATAPPPEPTATVPGSAAPATRRRWVMAVMGGEERRGRWRAGRRIGAVAVMGGVELDLREALLESDEIEIVAIAVMGGVEVIVPEGIPVETSGFVLMGGRSNRIAQVPPVHGAPRIVVRGYGMWGGIEVKSKKSPDEVAALRAARKAERATRRAERDVRRSAPADPPVEAPPASVPSQAEASAQREPAPLGALPGGLVTIVCTDIVGSTRLADRLGDQRWRGVLLAHNALVREQIARHGGIEVKQSGDGFLVTFDSARRAVSFALDVQQALADYRAGHPDTPLEARVGVHAGEVERDGTDVVGRNVHIACRVCDAAAPGEVLASAVVVDLADSSSDLAFDDAHDLRLAGIERTVRSHRARRR